jgi:hypothetical protein
MSLYPRPLNDLLAFLSIRAADSRLIRHAAHLRRRKMLSRQLLNLILDDEALTRGLADEEARLLVEWLADWAERLARRSTTQADVAVRVEQLRRRGRAIRQFVELWCYRQAPGAAAQLAATERFRWPLPDLDADPWELMHSILDFEDNMLHAA